MTAAPTQREVIHAAIATVVASLAYGLAFPPFHWTVLAFVAYAPVLWVLATSRHAVVVRWVGVVFGTLSHGLVLRWLYALFDVAALALWLVFGILHALAFAALFTVRERYGRRVMLALAPPVLLGIECFRSEWWFLRFPWATGGHALAADPNVAQVAELVGVYGLSLLCFVVASLLAAAATEGPRRRSGLGLVTLGLWLLVVAGGALRRGALERELDGDPSSDLAPLRVAVVQYETNGVDDAIRLAAEVPDDVELSVFPELGAALSGGRPLHADDPAMAARLRELALTARSAVAIGVTEPVPGAPAPAFFNTLLLLDEGGEALAHYHKAEPVPLFADGERSGPSDSFATPLGQLALCICYDFTHPHVTARTLDGAELVVVASGDLSSWTALQHEQHRMLARLRAIEHRRYVVRATSSGTSHVIDPVGRELVSMGFEEEGVRTATVWRRTGRTPIAFLGMTLPYGCLLLAVVVLGWALARSLRREPASPPGAV